MIRREMGSEFGLIRQDDHAALSGQLARHFGNVKFARPVPFESVITAVHAHDGGWPLHDDLPTLNNKQQPLDVFETPLSIALKVWTASAERALALDPYAGLLVSLHVLSLSGQAGTSLQKMDAFNLAQRFELNKFQHREVERQEALRRQLGLRTDLPLNLGLPGRHASERDDVLLFNFRLLQAMDLLSLSLCCTTLPASKSHDLFLSPGGKPVHLSITRPSPFALIVDPWPFDIAALDMEIPVRKIPAREYHDDPDLQKALAWAPVDQLALVLSSG
jgi:hypothetical protein